MDLDPLSAVETIFENHAPSPLADTLQRHLSANLRDQISLEKALIRHSKARQKSGSAPPRTGSTKNAFVPAISAT